MRPMLCLLAAALSVPVSSSMQRAEPFVPVGVWYGGGDVQPPALPVDAALDKEAWRRDMAALATLGFNSITTWVDWASAEPERGRYTFSTLEQLLSAADDVGLKVVVRIYTDAGPEWLSRRYPDARFIADQSAADAPLTSSGSCPDHPGVRAELSSFIGAATKAAVKYPSLHSIELRATHLIGASRAIPPPAAFCKCQYTTARLREWAARRYGDAPAQVDRDAFNGEKLQADLKTFVDLARASGARIAGSYSTANGAGRDDWRMATAVDYYGTRLEPKALASAWSPVRLMFTLDRVRSAAGDRGWWLSELQADSKQPAPAVTASDLRLWAWAAYSRGARAIAYAGWTRAWMTGPDGAFTDRAKAAGELAGNLTRNVRLFAPMRPRSSSVAVLESSGDGVTPAATDGVEAGPAFTFYRLMFEQNIQTDFIQPGQLLAGAAAKYSALYVDPSMATSPQIEQALKAYAAKGGTLIREDAANTPLSDSRIQRLLGSAGVKADVRVDGAAGMVEARFLESADAWLLVALNHADTAQTVTMNFAPDIPEAIWQNMESGSAVQFVQGPEGPTYRHRFGPRDVMLLVRAKKLR